MTTVDLRAVQELIDEWKLAYAAFQGAFDTPMARLFDSNEYAEDARKRLDAFNEKFANLPSTNAQAVAWQWRLKGKTEWMECFKSSFDRQHPDYEYRALCVCSGDAKEADYASLDAAIVKAIRNGHRTLVGISQVTRDKWEPDHRLLGARMTHLRKSGLIVYKYCRWSVVEKV